jgi:hypothetical protein
MLFLFPIFLFAAQPKEYFLDGLKTLEQRSHKCVELMGEICRVNTFFFNPVACVFFIKPKTYQPPSYTGQDICSRLLRNVGNDPLDFTASHPEDSDHYHHYKANQNHDS